VAKGEIVVGIGGDGGIAAVEQVGGGYRGGGVQQARVAVILIVAVQGSIVWRHGLGRPAGGHDCGRVLPCIWGGVSSKRM